MPESRELGGISVVMAMLNIKSRSSVYKKMYTDPDFPAPIQVVDKLEWFLDEIETYKESRPRRIYTAVKATVIALVIVTVQFFTNSTA